MSPPSENHEHRLLAAAQRGDEGAFEHLIGPYRGELQAHAYRMVGSLHDAEDAMQEAMLRAWRGIGRFEGRSSLRSWLYTITTNSSLRLIERRPVVYQEAAGSARRQIAGRFTLHGRNVVGFEIASYDRSRALTSRRSDRDLTRGALRAARERRARLHRRASAPAAPPARGADNDRRARLLAW